MAATRSREPFVHDGRNLQVRATSGDSGWNVAVFEDGDQVCPIIHVDPKAAIGAPNGDSEELVGDAMANLERGVRTGKVPLWPKKV